MSGYFSNIYKNVWFKGKSEIDSNNPGGHEPYRPQIIDWTDKIQANVELFRGLFYNTFPGFKLAGGMAFLPIMIPLQFMGLPVLKNKDNSEENTDLIDRYRNELQLIYQTSHIDGTCWVWPHYSAKLGRVIWEFIRDDTITDIIRDMDTREPVQIYTDENLAVSTGENVVVNIRRKRVFEKGRVTVYYPEGNGALNGLIRDYTMPNVGEVLPIPFANYPMADDIRGKSDYSRMLTDLKSYHDIELAADEFLSKHKPKWVQSVQDVGTWLKQNQLDLSTLSVPSRDFILNLYDQEKTEMIWPESVYEAYSQAKKDKFRKIVEAAAIPELFWGTRMASNMGNSDNQVDIAVKYVENKRTAKDKPQKILFDSTIYLEKIARLDRKPIREYSLDWNALDSISEAAKATIFKDFASGVATLMEVSGIGMEMVFKLWKANYPHATAEDWETFEKDLNRMAGFQQFSKAAYESEMDNQRGQGQGAAGEQSQGRPGSVRPGQKQAKPGEAGKAPGAKVKDDAGGV